MRGVFAARRFRARGATAAPRTGRRRRAGRRRPRPRARAGPPDSDGAGQRRRGPGGSRPGHNRARRSRARHSRSQAQRARHSLARQMPRRETIRGHASDDASGATAAAESPGPGAAAEHPDPARGVTRGPAAQARVTSAVATAAMPSPRPVRPSPSVVVPDTLTGAPPSASDSTFCASSRRGAIRGPVPDHLDRDVAHGETGTGEQCGGGAQQRGPGRPAHSGSAVPKLAPRSPRPAADSRASQAACAATSPSE